MLCTIFIPSRKRIERLKKTLQSVFDTANPGEFEIWLKFDDDDAESIAAIPELESRWQVKAFVGPRLKGYHSIEHFINLLLPKFLGKWLWVLNDDMTIEGSGWVQQLIAAPFYGAILHAKRSVNGHSRYVDDDGGAFPIVPKGFWLALGVPEIPSAYDAFCIQLAKNHGWQVRFLDGITTNHQRDNDQQLESHRTL